MTFFIPRANVIESDEGFSVEVVGPSKVCYRQNGQVIWIDSEFLVGPSGLIIYRNSARTEDSLHIDAEFADRVVANIRAAFAFRGFDIEIA